MASTTLYTSPYV